MDTRGYLTEDGQYYEGDRVRAADTEVSQRPDALHVPEYDETGAFTGWRRVAPEPPVPSPLQDLQDAVLQLAGLTDPVSLGRDPVFKRINDVRNGEVDNNGDGADSLG